MDAAGFGPFEFRVVGEHHIGADQCEVGAEAWALGEAEGVVEGGGFLEVFEREGKQPAVAAGFAADEVVVLAGGDRWMPDACDGWVIGQPFGESAAVGVDRIHALRVALDVREQDFRVADVERRDRFGFGGEM